MKLQIAVEVVTVIWPWLWFWYLLNRRDFLNRSLTFAISSYLLNHSIKQWSVHPANLNKLVCVTSYKSTNARFMFPSQALPNKYEKNRSIIFYRCTCDFNLFLIGRYRFNVLKKLEKDSKTVVKNRISWPW